MKRSNINTWIYDFTERADALTDENYHSEASTYFNIIQILQDKNFGKDSEKDLEAILTFLLTVPIY